MAEGVSSIVKKLLEDAGMDVSEDALKDIAENVSKAIGDNVTKDAVEDALADSVENVLKQSGDLLSNVTKDALKDYISKGADQVAKDTEEEAAIRAGTQVPRIGYPSSKVAVAMGNRIVSKMGGFALLGVASELIGHWAGFDKPPPDMSGTCTVQATDENDCNAIGQYLGAKTATFDKRGACRVSGGTVTQDSCKNVRKASFQNGMCTVTGSSIIDDRVCLDLNCPCSDDPSVKVCQYGTNPKTTNVCEADSDCNAAAQGKCVPYCKPLPCQTCNTTNQSNCPAGTSCRNRVCEHLRNVAAGNNKSKPYIQAQYINGACRLINITEPQCQRLGVIEIENVCQYGDNPKTTVACKTDSDCNVAAEGKCVPSYTNGNGNPMGGCIPPWGADCPKIVPPDARYATLVWIVVAVVLVLVLLWFLFSRAK